MITSGAKILSLVLCFILVAVTMPLEIEGQQATPPSGYSGQGAPLTAEELQGWWRPSHFTRMHW
jgi:hypothetical protein